MNHPSPPPVPDPPYTPQPDDRAARNWRQSKHLPAFVIGVVVLVLGAAAVVYWQPWRDSPEEVADAYMGVVANALENDEVENFLLSARPFLCADWRSKVDDLVDEHGSPGMPHLDYEMFNRMTFSFDYEILDSPTGFNSVTVEVRLSGESGGIDEEPEPFESVMSIDLVREGGAWLVCDDALLGVFGWELDH
jgi:hypothetical protein